MLDVDHDPEFIEPNTIDILSTIDSGVTRDHDLYRTNDESYASAGGAPFVVRRLRQFFERHLGDEWAEWMEAAARFRRGVRELDPPRPERERMYDKFFAETVADDLKARVPTQAEEDAWLTPRGEPPRHAPAHDAPTEVEAQERPRAEATLDVAPERPEDVHVEQDVKEAWPG